MTIAGSILNWMKCCLSNPPWTYREFHISVVALDKEVDHFLLSFPLSLTLQFFLMVFMDKEILSLFMENKNGEKKGIKAKAHKQTKNQDRDCGLIHTLFDFDSPSPKQ